MAGRTRVLAQIRQLCCLGLPSETVVPTLLRTVHLAVPATSWTFFWVDENCRVVNMYQYPATPELTALYVAEFYGKKELEAWPGATQLMKTAADVDWTLREVDRQKFFRSEFYETCLRPRGSYEPIHAAIRVEGRLRGVLMLDRGSGEKPFMGSDLAFLERIVPYLRHALESPPTSDPALTDGGESGLMILDRGGRLQFLCPRARRLWFYANHSRIAPDRRSHEQERSLSEAVAGLARWLAAIAGGHEMAPPLIHHRNAWGGFVFRAYWLEQAIADPSGSQSVVDTSSMERSLIGVTIQYQEPLSLKVTRAMQDLPLSDREKAVCLLLAQGLSHSAIAGHLNIRPTTVKTYVRRVHEKLGVTRSEDLLRKLISIGLPG